MNRLIILFVACLFLSGCVNLSSVFSGNSDEEFARNTDGTIAMRKTLFGERPIKAKKTRSQAAVASEVGGTSIAAIAKAEEARWIAEAAKYASGNGQQATCTVMPFNELKELTAAGQAESLRGLATCQLMQMVANIVTSKDEVLAAFSPKKSDIALVAENYGATARSLAAEGTKKVNALTGFGEKGIFGLAATSIFGDAFQANSDIARDGFAAAGDVNIRDINANNQTASASSNDGEGGFGGGGEGAGGAGGGGTGGGNIDQTSEGDNPVNFFFGDRNSFANAEPDGIVFTNNDNSQQLEESATGNVNTGRQTGQTTTDELNGDVDVDDADGTIN